MGKRIETTINTFNGGIANDPRSTRENTALMLTGFDLKDPHRLIPFNSSESGDGGASTSKKRNFTLALRTGTTWSLYALGVKSGASTAEVLYKDLTTGGSNDMGDTGWSTPANHQSASTVTNFNLFTYYKKTGLIYGARNGTHIWAFSPSGSAWDDDIITTNGGTPFAYTNIAEGLVHSKDDILYIPYDNIIAKNDNGAWSETALTLPTHLKINSICEYGNYLAIACAPLSGIGNSIVYLWDRDSTLTTLSESVNWGEGELKVLEELNGYLIGVSVLGGNTVNFRARVSFKYYNGNGAKEFDELVASSGSPTLLISKQKIDEKLYFMMSINYNGALREGVWSVSNPTELRIVHERTPNNDTALTNGVLRGFFYVGDYLFQSYQDNGTYTLSKTTDGDTFATSGIYEKRFNTEGSSKKKDLVGITVENEYLPSAGQIILEYRTDENTAWTNIFTNTTNNSISKSAVAQEGLPKDYKEIEFRVESTGGAVPTGLNFLEEITDKKPYAIK
jgi:hypothetical protein